VPDNQKIIIESFANISKVFMFLNVNINTIIDIDKVFKNKISLMTFYDIKFLYNKIMENYKLKSQFKKINIIIDEVDIFLDVTQSNLFIGNKFNKLDQDKIKMIVEYVYKKYNLLNINQNTKNINNTILDKLNTYYEKVVK
jgi:hypothetical protein